VFIEEEDSELNKAAFEENKLNRFKCEAKQRLSFLIIIKPISNINKEFRIKYKTLLIKEGIFLEVLYLIR